MDVLESCPKHNMVAYLEKTKGNAKFHEIIDFLGRSSIHNALTTISEASIRSDLLFDDADGIVSLPNQAIFDVIQLMGGATSERNHMNPNLQPLLRHPSEANVEPQSDPSPRPSPTTYILILFHSSNQKVSTDKENVSTDRPNVSTDRPNVSTDRPKVNTDKEKDSTISSDEGTEGRSATPITPTTTPTMFGDDETIARVLLNMSQAKVVSREKEKGVELMDVEETERPRPTSTRSLLTLKPLPKIDPKDKEKKKIEEEDESEIESKDIPEAEKKFKQLTKDEEMDRKLQEYWETEEERKRLAEEEATKTALSDEYDFIQARIEANRLLALRLQDEEREQFTVEERAKFLHDIIAAQRRFLAEQRAIAIRNKPPIRTQLRNQMMTYLNHVGNKKTLQLEEQKLRRNTSLYHQPDGTILLYTTNGTFRAFNYLMEVLHIFDRQDLYHLYNLMMEQYSEITLEGIELILWGDLKIMMESSTEENDQKFEDGTVIHMLVERRYPLSKDLLQRMLDLGLEVERESIVAFDLIRFIKQQIDEE
ncbi:hypothetical protein Tco_0657260 [Tanacetum coccineum]|uniref:Uncharacterized protein n=1 Tax=Tanacetum coccineum TaxID=301880 RepID=A0ABQ4XCE0_9ASTR